MLDQQPTNRQGPATTRARTRADGTAPWLSRRQSRRMSRRMSRRLSRRWFVDDRGAATAEYVVATMAAVGFAGLLIVILRGDEVRSILTDLVRNALTVG